MLETPQLEETGTAMLRIRTCGWTLLLLPGLDWTLKDSVSVRAAAPAQWTLSVSMSSCIRWSRVPEISLRDLTGSFLWDLGLECFRYLCQPLTVLPGPFLE